MDNQFKQELITLPLTQYVEDVIGSAHHATISWQSAEILQLKASKLPAFIHVQTSDHAGLRLEHPILWKWAAWRADCESWRRAQNISHQQRVQRFIDEKNLYLVAKGITRFSGIEGDFARLLAMRKIKRGHFNFIKEHLGVTLITDEKQL